MKVLFKAMLVMFLISNPLFCPPKTKEKGEKPKIRPRTNLGGSFCKKHSSLPDSEFPFADTPSPSPTEISSTTFAFPTFRVVKAKYRLFTGCKHINDSKALPLEKWIGLVIIKTIENIDSEGLEKCLVFNIYCACLQSLEICFERVVIPDGIRNSSFGKKQIFGTKIAKGFQFEIKPESEVFLFKFEQKLDSENPNYLSDQFVRSKHFPFPNYICIR